MLTAMSVAWFQKHELPRPGAEDANCAGPGQPVLLEPGHRHGGEHAARRAAIDADVPRLIAFQELPIDRRDVLARGREAVCGTLAIIEADHLDAPERSNRY